MILLNKKDYNVVVKPLQEVTINNLFARSVVEGHVDGRVYVNDVDEPSVFYVVHKYGMSLLFGDIDDKEFNKEFKEYALKSDREVDEWMQAFPAAWDEVLSDMFEGQLVRSSESVIELNTRVNFSFDEDRYTSFRRELPFEDLEIVKVDEEIFDKMEGGVVPSKFWNDSKDFIENGVGFSLFYDGELASTAFSSYVHDGLLELGIETAEGYRGKGFAQHTCSALIDHCLKNDYEPVWSCRLENTGSYRLAVKLGFRASLEIPYYRLRR